MLQCFCCKEFGHMAANCSKKYCSYCKKKGHIIKECRIRPQNCQAQALQTSVIVPPTMTFAALGSSSGESSIPAPPTANYCTPKMVQRMLISALSAMGLQGPSNGGSRSRRDLKWGACVHYFCLSQHFLQFLLLSLLFVIMFQILVLCGIVV
ncbi:uncharacterized protein LOC131149757 [Malania oleifera]|uniref:uncharacterized protein LOC131149757 n=1 Tax=Malania oleifera TaxID=397392 RepID=UPI0025AE5118|nr:uncharacterized protein LOC131149757 [Malania oleifera]